MPDSLERRRANTLSGVEWTRNSISVWSDLRRTPQETALKHPALFPASLVERVIQCLMPPAGGTVLDPFSGSGSTVLAASRLGYHGIGFDVAEGYLEMSRRRLTEEPDLSGTWELHHASALDLGSRVAPGSVQLTVTSPPYWDVLSRRRSADGRGTRDYAGSDGDLSRLDEYPAFVEGIGCVFDAVASATTPRGYLVVNVMDIRKGARFYPFHMDLARRLAPEPAVDVHPLWELDDIVIWDRRADYNSLRPLGFPAVFRVNKVHEYLMIFRRTEVEVGASETV